MPPISQSKVKGITKISVIRNNRLAVTSTVKVSISIAVATRVVLPGEGDNVLIHMIHHTTLKIAPKNTTAPDIIVKETTIITSVIGTASHARQISHQSSTVGIDTIGVRMVGDGHRIIPVLLYRLILCSRGNHRKDISITGGREGSRNHHTVTVVAIDTVDTTNTTTVTIKIPTISRVMTAKGEPTVER